VFLLKGVEGLSGGRGEGLGVVDVKYCCKRCDGSGVGGIGTVRNFHFRNNTEL
jgi:hypothetical protein